MMQSPSMREAAARLLPLLDLTDLSDTCRSEDIRALVKRAETPYGPVAAICIWQHFVAEARLALGDAPIKLATVVNFPEGNEDTQRVVEDTHAVMCDGADEVDLVMPYRALMRGDEKIVHDMIAAVRGEMAPEMILKVILETGILAEAALIAKASRIAIEAGAHFLKTSTGKTKTGATLPAAETMLHEIKASGRPVGLKISGGIKTLADAMPYLSLAARLMGEDWIKPSTFRIGASALLDDLLATIEASQEN